VIVHEFLCEESDRSLCDELAGDVRWNSRNGSHFRAMNPHSSNTYKDVVRKSCAFFEVELANALMSYYPNGSSWRQPHHDAYKFNSNLRENMTVIASLGDTRVLSFKHQTNGILVHAPLKNGMLIYFNDGINNDWKHGIEPLLASGHSTSRVAISMWGISRLQAH
jgi:hypothetical protein